ncbi:MAG: FecR domain-containing protein [Ignavibacteriaceae bacterium]|nr:FecR domain-containing protein [Ignavibacteriaceae bacterium]
MIKQIFFVLMIFHGVLLFGQSEIKVVVKSGETVRDIAREHLKDPDLWEEILRSNNLKSPEQVKPGMTLVIPVESILKAKNQISKALKAINDATEAGAKTFAAQSINTAIELYNEALAERKAGNWKKSFDKAVLAEKQAGEAKKLAESKSKTTSDATVASGKGKIESKKPADPLWKDAPVRSKLFENDRLRTLSNSFAEILFQDNSKIKLSENSQLVIQKARVDLLQNKSESEVKLEKGNAFAFLSGKSPKKDFKVSVPGAETEVNSKAFFLKKEEKSTKIANYDGEIALKGKGKSVVVKENQGSTVSDNGSVSDPKNLLPSPGIKFPENNAKYLADTISFAWNPVTGARRYWFQLATDKDFNNPVFTSKTLTVTSYKLTLEPGVYYWQVSAEDADGFPGPYTKPSVLFVESKTTYAYLTIQSPQNETVTDKDEILVTGATDLANTIEINSNKVEVDPNTGSFSLPVKLTKGNNSIVVKAVNPNGGENSVTLRIKYEVDSVIALQFDPSLLKDMSGSYIIPSSEFVLRGTTNASAQVLLRSTVQNYHLKTFSNENGEFTFTLQKFTRADSFYTTVVSRSGHRSLFADRFVLDDVQPVITLSSEPPQFTNKKLLEITGSCNNVRTIEAASGEAVINGETFSYRTELRPGQNQIDLTAVAPNGRTMVIRRNIYLDLEAPVLGVYNMTPLKVPADRYITVTIAATDISGLKRTAKLIYSAGEDVFSETLLYNDAAGMYQGRFLVRSKINTDLILRSVLLEDYFGNFKEYKLK